MLVPATFVPVLAQETAEGAGFLNLLMIVFLIAAFYFLLIRPQSKARKQQRQLVASLQQGDRVITIGGLHGTIRYVDDDVIHLDVGSGTQLTFNRGAVARKVVDAETGETP